MPGGNPAAWDSVKDIFQSIAAKVEDGTPCCDWVGERGAGHYTKMIHNGIEYGDMQLICEAYNLLSVALNLDADELSEVFNEWNEGELDSYLIQITAEIFAKKDEDGAPMIDKILDTAGQKGSGKWTGISSLDLGVPVTLIGEAVYARCLSAMKDERVIASKVLNGTERFARRQSKRINRRRAAGFVLFKNYFLRAGLYADARSVERTKLETEFRRNRFNVARRLYHSKPFFREN